MLPNSATPKFDIADQDSRAGTITTGANLNASLCSDIHFARTGRAWAGRSRRRSSRSSSRPSGSGRHTSGGQVLLPPLVGSGLVLSAAACVSAGPVLPLHLGRRRTGPRVAPPADRTQGRPGPASPAAGASVASGIAVSVIRHFLLRRKLDLVLVIRPGRRRKLGELDLVPLAERAVQGGCRHGRPATSRASRWAARPCGRGAAAAGLMHRRRTSATRSRRPRPCAHRAAPFQGHQRQDRLQGAYP